MTLSTYTIRPLTPDELTGKLLQHALWTFAGGLGYRRGDSRVEALAAAMRRHAGHGEYWLTDAFELAELHVHPSVQGQGFGSRLHDALLQDVPHRTALLSVMHRSERARQLYTRRGWETLIEDMRFPTEPRTPFSVLGLRLTLCSHPRQAPPR